MVEEINNSLEAILGYDNQLRRNAELYLSETKDTNPNMYSVSLINILVGKKLIKKEINKVNKKIIK